jgi:hypothetical protein
MRSIPLTVSHIGLASCTSTPCQPQARREGWSLGLTRYLPGRTRSNRTLCRGQGGASRRGQQETVSEDD